MGLALTEFFFLADGEAANLGVTCATAVSTAVIALKSSGESEDIAGAYQVVAQQQLSFVSRLKLFSILLGGEQGRNTRSIFLVLKPHQPPLLDRVFRV